MNNLGVKNSASGQKFVGYGTMCAGCYCSVVDDCAFVMALVRFEVKNLVGHVS